MHGQRTKTNARTRKGPKKTVGRGKKSRVHHQIIPIKDIWLYPLRKDFARILCG